MTEDGKRDAIAEELQVASDELEIAELLLDSRRYRVAVARAYFAVFHAARARLYADGLEPKSHSGVHTLWSSHLVKSGQYEPATALTLARLQTYRGKADYARSFMIDETSARTELAAATELVQRIAADLA